MSAKIEELECAVTHMHSLAEEGLSQIESLANLAAKQISNHNITTIDLNDLAQVMCVIRNIAQSSMSAIDIEAENAGGIKAIQIEEAAA